MGKTHGVTNETPPQKMPASKKESSPVGMAKSGLSWFSTLSSPDLWSSGAGGCAKGSGVSVGLEPGAEPRPSGVSARPRIRAATCAEDPPAPSFSALDGGCGLIGLADAAAPTWSLYLGSTGTGSASLTVKEAVSDSVLGGRQLWASQTVRRIEALISFFPGVAPGSTSSSRRQLNFPS